MQCLGRCAVVFVLLGAALCAAALAGAYVLTAWLSAADTPGRAGAMLVLGGDPSRALEAAELYRAGLAPKIYIVAPMRDEGLSRLDEAGIASPREEELTQRALIARGVPDAAIELLGRDLRSTVQEANLAAQRLAQLPGGLLVVTSPYHVHRVRMIFSDALPGQGLRVVGSRFEPLPASWWTDQTAARNILLELAKTGYYVASGRF
jgi:uncharacterized SAM-binding protein YcdF (DUF218 family)